MTARDAAAYALAEDIAEQLDSVAGFPGTELAIAAIVQSTRLAFEFACNQLGATGTMADAAKLRFSALP